MSMQLFDISIEKTAIEHNVRAVTNTIILSREGKNKMLPYMERVAKMLPEVADRIHESMTNEEIYIQIEDLITARFAENEEVMRWKIRHFESLAQKPLYDGIGKLLDIFGDRKSVV